MAETLAVKFHRATRLVLAAVCLALGGGAARAAEFFVSSAAQIHSALQLAQPGDTLVMADGVWTNQNIQFDLTSRGVTSRSLLKG